MEVLLCRWNSVPFPPSIISLSLLCLSLGLSFVWLLFWWESTTKCVHYCRCREGSFIPVHDANFMTLSFLPYRYWRNSLICFITVGNEYTACFWLKNHNGHNCHMLGLKSLNSVFGCAERHKQTTKLMSKCCNCWASPEALQVCNVPEADSFVSSCQCTWDSARANMIWFDIH